MPPAAIGPPGISQRLPESAFVARTLAAVCVAAATVTFSVDPDLWGHLRFGLDALRDRALTAQDPYSFTSDIPWINHEWLSETLMGLAYAAGGVVGLIALKAAVVGTAYALIAQALRPVASPARWLLLFVAVVATFTITTTLRPQVWTVLALAVITCTTHWGLRRQFVLWPVVFALWANLHGGWLVGLGVVGAWSAGVVLDRRDLRLAAPLGALGALCAAATLLTPYGAGLWRFMWGTVGFERAIVEWRPIWELGSLVGLMWGTVAVTAAVAMLRTPWSWASALPVFMLAVASLKVGRLIGLFGVVVIILLGSRWRHAPAPVFRPALLFTIWLVALIPAALAGGGQLRCLAVDGDSRPDLEAAGALAGPGVQGRLMVPFNWGQYAIWHFSPNLVVSMDGRRETVYSLPLIEQQLALDHGDVAIVPFIRSERPDYVWLYWPKGEPIATALKGQYRQDLTTGRSVVLTRSDLPVLARTAALPACFP